MSNYIKAVKTVATATTAEIVDLISSDDIVHITSSGATNLQFVYKTATGATTASNVAVTVVVASGSSAAANLAAAQKSGYCCTAKPRKRSLFIRVWNRWSCSTTYYFNCT